ANTRPVTMLVDGYVTELSIQNNQEVKKDQLLFRVYQPTYALQVKALEKSLDAARHRTEALAKKILAADAQVRSDSAKLANQKYLSSRADFMYQSGVAVSQEYAQIKLREMESAVANLEGSKHNADAARSEYEESAATVKSLEHKLALQKIYLEWTEVRALSDGVVTNMSVSPGGYYNAGTVLFGFVDHSVWFVQANFKESELSTIRKGQHAEIWLWQYPGKTFHGIVEEIHWNAERRRNASSGLSQVEKENEWFLLPQRFPVQIRILDPDKKFPFHLGGSAFVRVNTPAHPIRQFFWELFLI
ncbi:MAG: efflux RND transporter periplasmic adaptor subunit, partial [Victivallaceae bacterium]|nr:efflux RND transporter periplasmic adaptor subunit [Victivallaceae bacterium]